MPRVEFLQSVAGPDVSYTVGQTVDMAGPEASKWADGVRARLVRAAPPETPEGAARTAAGGPEITARTPRRTVRRSGGQSARE